MDLFRGQVAGDVIGMSWSRSPSIATKFALYGMRQRRRQSAAHLLSRPALPHRADGVLLRADVNATEILCAPCLLGHKEGEFIVDPRDLKVTVTPIGRQIEERR